jgi:hypothetical protein
MAVVNTKDTVPGLPFARTELAPNPWRESEHRPILSPARCDLSPIADTPEAILAAWAIDGGGALLLDREHWLTGEEATQVALNFFAHGLNNAIEKAVKRVEIEPTTLYGVGLHRR